MEFCKKLTNEGGEVMPKCHDLKKDEVYGCEHCKLEVKVIKECVCEDDPEVCACYSQPHSCMFACCNEEMKKISG